MPVSRPHCNDDAARTSCSLLTAYDEATSPAVHYELLEGTCKQSCLELMQVPIATGELAAARSRELFGESKTGIPSHSRGRWHSRGESTTEVHNEHWMWLSHPLKSFIGTGWRGVNSVLNAGIHTSLYRSWVKPWAYAQSAMTA